MSKVADTLFMDTIKEFSKRGTFSPKLQNICEEFFTCYARILHETGKSQRDHIDILNNFLKYVEEQAVTPYQFEPYHEAIRKPFDFFAFGQEFIRPLINFETSTFTGEENLEKVRAQVKRKENVVFLGNHQTEAEPQVISLALEQRAPELIEQIIYVAGERVTSDPVAVPLSKGRNLICIYSKKYFATNPEQRAVKQAHNQRAMTRLGSLLADGGQVVYIAPSGGRDRKNSEGVLEVAPFDPKSIEMLRLYAKNSPKPVHFYPLAISSHNLMPPPETTVIELGEQRVSKCDAIHLAICDEVDIDLFEGDASMDKRTIRSMRAKSFWQEVCKAYNNFPI